MVETLAQGQPFKEAADFFAQKVNLPTDRWTDLREGMHSRAFVVAGAKKDQLLADFRQAIQRAIDEGRTLEDFRQDFDRIVERHGWSYRGSRGWRSRVIFDTNLRTAYAAGRWQQIQRLQDRFPFLEYQAVDDARTRPLHAAWDGTILPVTDEWWSTHYPPNGWNCRCTVRMLSERKLRREGKSVTDRPPVEMQDRTVRTTSGTANWRTPEGIDTGFGYNPGEAAFGQRLDEATMAAWREQGAKAWERLTPGNWKDRGRPPEIPADEPQRLPADSTPDDAEQFVREQLGGEQKIVPLPDGSQVALTAPALAQHIGRERLRFVPLIEEALRNPYEIWMSFERHKGTGRVQLRKRIIKAVRVGGTRFVVTAAQAAGGRFEAWTAVPTRQLGYARNQRVGELLYSRDGDAQ